MSSTVNVKNTLGERLVTRIEQVPKEYRESSKKVVEFVYGKLEPPYVYYRRGDSRLCYEENSNFIPLWVYLLLFNHVIFFLRATRDEFRRPSPNKEAFRNYCGMYPEELPPFTEKSQIIVLLENDENNAYHKDVFGEFFEKFPRDAKLMRAQLWEDIQYQAEGKTFAQKIDERKKGWLSLFNDFPPSSIGQYKEVAKSNDLMPKGRDDKETIDKLAGFVAEKCLWQEIHGLRENVDMIKKAMQDRQSFAEAYQLAHCFHYQVGPDVYSRNGFTALANREDFLIARYIEDLPLLMPFQSHRYSEPEMVPPGLLPPLRFPFPRDSKPPETKRALRILLQIQEDSHLGPARQKVIESVRDFGQVSQFLRNPIDFRTNTLIKFYNAKRRFNDEMERFVRQRGRELLLTDLVDSEIGMVNCKDSKAHIENSLQGGLWENMKDAFLLFVRSHLHIDPLVEIMRVQYQEIEKREQAKLTELISRSLDQLSLSLPRSFSQAPFIVINYPNPRSRAA